MAEIAIPEGRSHWGLFLFPPMLRPFMPLPRRTARNHSTPSGGFPPWRTVYGWFRCWLEAGVFDALMQGIARLRRRSVGRRAAPRLCIIGTQAVKYISVRGPRGYDAGKGVWGRKRVALVDAAGHWLAVAVVPASVQSLSSRRRGTATPFRRWTAARRCGQACGKRSMTAPSPPRAAGHGRTCTACAIASSSAIRRPRALSSSRGDGWWSGALLARALEWSRPRSRRTPRCLRWAPRPHRHPLRRRGFDQSDANSSARLWPF